MSTIFAAQAHAPRRSGARFASASIRYRKATSQLRRWHEGFDSDRNSSLSEIAVRPYAEARFRN